MDLSIVLPMLCVACVLLVLYIAWSLYDDYERKKR